MGFWHLARFSVTCIFLPVGDVRGGDPHVVRDGGDLVADSQYLTRHAGWAGCRVRLNLPLRQRPGGTVRPRQSVPPLLLPPDLPGGPRRAFPRRPLYPNNPLKKNHRDPSRSRYDITVLAQAKYLSHV